MSQGISKASMVSGGVLKDLILLSLTLCKSRQLRGVIPLFYKCFIKKISLWIYPKLRRISGF